MLVTGAAAAAETIHVASLSLAPYAGKDVVIARGGKPVAQLTRLEAAARKILIGVLKGKATVAKDFDAALPAQVLAVFEGR